MSGAVRHYIQKTLENDMPRILIDKWDVECSPAL